MNCNCTCCDDRQYTQFQRGDTIDIAFSLLKEQGATYYVSLINERTNKLYWVKQLEEITEFVEGNYLLTIPHNKTATMLCDKYHIEIAIKVGSTTKILSNSIGFQIMKNITGQHI